MSGQLRKKLDASSDAYKCSSPSWLRRDLPPPTLSSTTQGQGWHETSSTRGSRSNYSRWPHSKSGPLCPPSLNRSARLPL
ncbi:hypothetical protein CC79DRAFT_685908 [Sarocladium strictum]